MARNRAIEDNMAKSSNTPPKAEAPVENVTETPAETVVETPAETVVETPAETVVETPAETVVETPAETVVETPAETVVETPAETDQTFVVDPIYADAVSKLIAQGYSDIVMVSIPAQFTLADDSKRSVSYPAGIQPMPRQHCSHWYSKANGVTLVGAIPMVAAEVEIPNEPDPTFVEDSLDSVLKQLESVEKELVKQIHGGSDYLSAIKTKVSEAADLVDSALEELKK